MRAPSFFVRMAWVWALALLLPGCIDPYMPDAINSNKSYLVVNGFINSKGATTIMLSRTFNISSKDAPPVEARATVYIEEEGGVRYSVPESPVPGTYTSAALLLAPARNYRLHILTSDGKDYASDFVPAKTTPAIDSLVWRTTPTGLTISLNAHDDTNSTQYYRWDYEETWEIVPPYKPAWEYFNRNIRRLLVPYPTLCWSNAKSNDIKITSTTRLSKDVVSDYLIRSFPVTASQLTQRYSILVKQYAQTPEEYQYWELLKKNTENIGTLFDPLPAQLTGNVRCLNDEAELAIGYVGAYSAAEKRIFINRRELPADWRIQNGYEDCVPTDTVDLYPRGIIPPPTPAAILQAAFSNPTYLPIDQILDDNLRVIGYTAKTRDCIDCRTRGTSVKPSFWP